MNVRSAVKFPRNRNFRPSASAEVNLSALQRNFKRLRRLAGKALLWPVVKADAYGHGLVEVARALRRAGADRFTVAFWHEGARLRQAGIRAPILLIAPLAPGEEEEALRWRLTPQVSSFEGALALSRAARKQGVLARVHVEIDSGMGRVGFSPEEWRRAAAKVRALPFLRVEMIYTHLATADWENPVFAKKQVRAFQELLAEENRKVGGGPSGAHLANSAALLSGFSPKPSLGARPGLSLYGVYPHPRFRKSVALEPVMTFRAKLIHVKTLKKGESVSYGRTFIAPRRMRVGVLGIGYADGVLRSLSNRGAVWIKGKRAPICGAVCMDMTMVDLTACRDARPGDEAVVFGREGKKTYPVEEQAEAARTIPYELLCAVGSRIPRIYKGGGSCSSGR